MYNLATIEKIAEGDEDFTFNMIRTFLEEMFLDLNYLQEAIENQNTKLAYQVIHKMKPNYEVFEIDLHTDINKIEDWCKGKDTYTGVVPVVDQLIQKTKIVCQKLREDFQL